MLHGESIVAAADGCTLTQDDGSVDCTLGIALLMAIYWVYGFQYPKGLKKTFAFFEHYIFELKSKKTVPVPVVRLHTELVHK